MQIVERQQLVHAPIEHTFAYFSDPRQLPQITPPWLRFRVERFAAPRIFAGCEIDYTIRWLGLPLGWTTLIAAYDEGHRFVDTQKRGPYRRWWHEHTFVAVNGDTLMTDRVEYDMPLGVVGTLADRILVRRQLNAILDYRERVTDAIFPPR